MTLKVLSLLLLTAILWGSTPIIEKYALTGSQPLIGVTVRSLAITFILILFHLFSGRWREVVELPLKSKVLFSLSGIMAGLLGMLTYFYALKASPASKAVPIAATYPLIAALLGIIILGENLTASKLIGTVLIIAGVWMVK